MEKNKILAKKILDNGLTLLVCESHNTPKVSVQMWYNVGSKDELLEEKGMAHLIEHMIFKGTDILSESDIDTLVRKLSGTCNAFTYYDYTGYFFNFPTHHWQEALPVLASCMTNCSFKNDMLISEIKTVIQELKLSRDHYGRSLLKEMISTIFADHPYHYPVLGYKQDLLNVTTKDLHSFYKQHYKPNNATLVVVGDVQAEKVFSLAQASFEHIKSDTNYTKKNYFFHKDIGATEVILYRDITQPIAHYMFVVPGASQKQDTALSILEWIIGKGKSSRLYKKLVNETAVATNVTICHWSLVDWGVFCIIVDQKNSSDLPAIEKIICTELENLIQHGVYNNELNKSYKNAKIMNENFLEDLQNQACMIGQSFIATGDEQYVFSSFDHPIEFFKQEIQNIIKTYFRPTLMHKGYVLPLPEQEKNEWTKLQEQSDALDTKILITRTRSTAIEPPLYSPTITIRTPTKFVFPKPEHFVLSNGLKIFYYNNPTTPKITITLEFKAQSYFDKADKQGLYTFVTRMMMEGTQKYTNQMLIDALESKGISIDIHPGKISLQMLHDDFECSLDLLQEIVISATFPEQKIEKVREQLLAHIKQYWDEPQSFVNQLVRQEIYKNHPYNKQALGTQESIQSITRQDLIDFYQKYISPHGARMAIVGNIHEYNIQELVGKKLHNWRIAPVNDIIFPSPIPCTSQEINYPINRDQVTLCLAQLSISRLHPDFDKYLLFDHIFCGGALGSVGSRLFDLREQTGLFYTIKGSLLTNADEQPGMFQICTTVSLDRLTEAEKIIKNNIDIVIDTITEEELNQAKRAVINTLVNNFVSNSSIANAFLLLDRFHFPKDYFDSRAAHIEHISLDEIKKAVKNILVSENMITIRIGRI